MRSALQHIIDDVLKAAAPRRERKDVPAGPPGRGMSQKNLDLIEHCRSILAEVQPTTVRGVAYQLFTRGLIENMGNKCVRNVSRMLVIARENGTIPWSWIVDDTRLEKYFPKWNGLEDFGEHVVSQYRSNFWQHQDSWI